jgi:hypothetical protein
VTYIFTFVTTDKHFITGIIALRRDSTAYDGRLNTRTATRTRLRLTVDNWAFFAEPHMAGLSTFVLLAVKQLSTVELARMII